MHIESIPSKHYIKKILTIILNTIQEKTLVAENAMLAEKVNSLSIRINSPPNLLVQSIQIHGNLETSRKSSNDDGNLSI